MNNEQSLKKYLTLARRYFPAQGGFPFKPTLAVLRIRELLNSCPRLKRRHYVLFTKNVAPIIKLAVERRKTIRKLSREIMQENIRQHFHNTKTEKKSGSPDNE